MHDPGGKYSRGLFGETGDFSFTSGMDIEVDLHPPFRHEHDFHLRGAITIWLDVGSSLRTWLVVLPFIGVLVDILAIWLKAFVSPAFFWLHVPGGGLFAAVFAYVSLRALWEMWFIAMPKSRHRS